METTNITRRGILRGALAGALAIPVVGTVAACATGGAPSAGGAGGASQTPAGEVTADNPFGIASGTEAEAVIFDGGYGVDYVEFAADIVQEAHGVTIQVQPSTQIAQELQPRFVSQTPPDLIDNSGAQAMGVQDLVPQLTDLTQLVDSTTIEGETIRDLLVPGVVERGTFDGKFVTMNYVLTIYGLWYSQSLFEANGWTPPATFDDLMTLGAAAQAQGRYLFTFGTEAATYYQTFVIDAAVKEGGLEVLEGLQNLAPDAWSHPALQSAITGLEAIIQAGYMRPGGEGTQFTAAQAQWSNAQEAILYPSGSWIENEMKDNTAENFVMTGIPTPSVTAGAALPATAVHMGAGEPFMVPSDGPNTAVGLEILRTMLSAEASDNFVRTKLSPTVIQGSVPEDGFGSSALASQGVIIEGAGSDAFDYNFAEVHGLNPDQLVPWNSFLAGQMSAADLTAALQAISDAAAA